MAFKNMAQHSATNSHLNARTVHLRTQSAKPAERPTEADLISLSNSSASSMSVSHSQPTSMMEAEFGLPDAVGSECEFYMFARGLSHNL